MPKPTDMLFHCLLNEGAVASSLTITEVPGRSRLTSDVAMLPGFSLDPRMGSMKPVTVVGCCWGSSRYRRARQAWKEETRNDDCRERRKPPIGSALDLRLGAEFLARRHRDPRRRHYMYISR